MQLFYMQMFYNIGYLVLLAHLPLCLIILTISLEGHFVPNLVYILTTERGKWGESPTKMTATNFYMERSFRYEQ